MILQTNQENAKQLKSKEIVLFYEFLNCYESNLKLLENEKSIVEITKEFKSKVKEFKLNINVVNRGKGTSILYSKF